MDEMKSLKELLMFFVRISMGIWGIFLIIIIPTIALLTGLSAIARHFFH